MFTKSTFLPLLNSGSFTFVSSAESDVSNATEAFVVICLRFDLVGVAPGGITRLFIRLPLLPLSNKTMSGLSQYCPCIASQHNSVMGAKSGLATLLGVGIVRPVLKTA